MQVLVLFVCSRSPVVGVLQRCCMWHGVPFANHPYPLVGTLAVYWLLWGSFDFLFSKQLCSQAIHNLPLCLSIVMSPKCLAPHKPQQWPIGLEIPEAQTNNGTVLHGPQG